MAPQVKAWRTPLYAACGLIFCSDVAECRHLASQNAWRAPMLSFSLPYGSCSQFVVISLFYSSARTIRDEMSWFWCVLSCFLSVALRAVSFCCACVGVRSFLRHPVSVHKHLASTFVSLPAVFAMLYIIVCCFAVCKTVACAVFAALYAEIGAWRAPQIPRFT